jgi:poly(hydroxyalkanoate) depolymerase family esterase
VAFRVLILFFIACTANAKSFEFYNWGHRVVVHSPETSHKLPVVVLLHGCQQTADNFIALTRFKEESLKRHFVLVAPEQSLFKNPYRCWNWFQPMNQYSHFPGSESMILESSIDTAVANANADSNRVYLVGLSAGSAMAYNLFAIAQNRYRGIALHSGTPYRSATTASEAIEVMKSANGNTQELAQELFRQNQNQKVALKSFVVIQGDNDQVVNLKNANNITSQFLGFADLIGQPELKLIVNKILIKNLGHAWSGGSSGFSYSDPNGPDATGLILNSFGL